MCVESARHRPSRSKRSAPRSYAKHHQPGHHRAKAAGAARRWCVTHRVPPRPSNVTWSQAIIIAPYRFCRLQLFSSRHEGKCITARRHGNGAAAAPSRAESTDAETNTGYALWLSDLTLMCVLSVLAQLRTASEWVVTRNRLGISLPGTSASSVRHHRTWQLR